MLTHYYLQRPNISKACKSTIHSYSQKSNYTWYLHLLTPFLMIQTQYKTSMWIKYWTTK
jgi:hypothetical protein